MRSGFVVWSSVYAIRLSVHMPGAFLLSSPSISLRELGRELPHIASQGVLGLCDMVGVKDTLCDILFV